MQRSCHARRRTLPIDKYGGKERMRPCLQAAPKSISLLTFALLKVRNGARSQFCLCRQKTTDHGCQLAVRTFVSTWKSTWKGARVRKSRVSTMTMATALGSILSPTNAAAKVADDVNEERAYTKKVTALLIEVLRRIESRSTRRLTPTLTDVGRWQ